MIKRYLTGLMVAIAYAGIMAAGNAAGMDYPEQSSSVQGVSVTVTPPDFAPAADTWNFAVLLQTHVRNLEDDLVQSARLVADGKQYMPLSWEGAPPGGHHRKGVLRFRAVTPRPHAVELQLPLAGENTPRNFRWQLQ